jgi:hypothetical protein
MEKIIGFSQMTGYIQINHSGEKIYGQEMTKIFMPLESEKFKLVKIVKKKRTYGLSLRNFLEEKSMSDWSLEQLKFWDDKICEKQEAMD